MSDIINYFKKRFPYQLILDKTIKTVIIILGAVLLYQLLRLFIRRIANFSFKRIHLHNENIIRKRQKTLEKIILSLLRYFFYFVTFLIILANLGININTILTGAGILGVVFAVGSQNLVKDFVEGFFNVFEDNLSVGDYVLIDECEGTVTDIGLRTIKIKSYSGEVHVIPNSKIGHLVNYSLDEGKALVDILLSYDADIEEAINVINKVLEDAKAKNENILTLPSILGINKLQPLGYEIRIMCLTRRETHWSVQRFLRQELLKIMKLKGIPLGVNQLLLKNYKSEKKESN